MTVTGLDDPVLGRELGAEGYKQLRDEAELLDAAGDAFDRERFERGEVTPMFFGSAINNFGLEAFLESFCDLMPPPAPRTTSNGADRGRAIRASAPSSSRSRRTWTARTAIASRSCASARAASSAA